MDAEPFGIKISILPEKSKGKFNKTANQLPVFVHIKYSCSDILKYVHYSVPTDQRRDIR